MEEQLEEAKAEKTDTRDWFLHRHDSHEKGGLLSGVWLARACLTICTCGVVRVSSLSS